MAVKGKTNNPNGRPKGVPNKITTDLRSGIDAFLKKRWSEVDEIWERLDDKDKIGFMDKMMKYAIPTLQSTTLDAKVESSDRLQKLNAEQLNTVIDLALEKAGVCDGEED